jgi:hypothetical protein
MFENFSGFRLKAERIGGAALALFNYIASLQADIDNCDTKIYERLAEARANFDADRTGVASECLTGPIGADGFITRKCALQCALNSPALHDLYKILIIDSHYPDDLMPMTYSPYNAMIVPPPVKVANPMAGNKLEYNVGDEWEIKPDDYAVLVSDVETANVEYTGTELQRRAYCAAEGCIYAINRDGDYDGVYEVVWESGHLIVAALP